MNTLDEVFYFISSPFQYVSTQHEKDKVIVLKKEIYYLFLISILQIVLKIIKLGQNGVLNIESFWIVMMIYFSEKKDYNMT